MVRKKILFVIPTQYGYHTDSYKYCELLAEQYDVYYIGLDLGKTERKSKRVNVFLENPKKYLFWRLTFLVAVLKLHKKYRFNKIFIYYFPLCSFFLWFLPKNIVVMDIRTSFIEGKYKSKLLNKLLTVESRFFKKISVISWGVVDFLSLNKQKCSLLPLGGDDVPFYSKAMNKMSLLYVGTFYDRYIEKTIEGLYLFRKNNSDVEVEYTIIGMGTNEEKQKIIDSISNYKMSDIVHFIGEKRHEELIPYFKSHNIGISYIPLTDYYDCQPPTKTFEYLLNTMIVLATPTLENKRVINDTNGILMENDSPLAFAHALELLSREKEKFDMKKIYISSQQYSWKDMVNRYLIDIVES